MIRPTIFVVALGLQTAAAAAQTTTPTPAPTQATPSATAPAAAKPGITLAKFEARREKAFMAADTDGDGKVSLAEWTAFQTGRKAKGDPARSFARMDANHDGFIDKSELDALLAKRFARLDKNSDGTLGADERPGHKTAPNQEQ
ncbi:EF-hand domain-containing protein [Mesorhizobium sp.]|uniref:EF-hand domain-containing protein n=1 Tax=Mesorhizobium sp. TaxID=1871066 RepID=UPI000FE3294A|nr:acid-shock protein [Mesorhizobium sp.]RWA77459.1 MAG: acid-shock protein [Mesorhizobium sp.]RWC05733.1 MAG: acid-shock protein [Mesorhizobium sp.]RWG87770.1 MAG: acid-shock protein [Mesorhizobium sp.]RWG91610.1 MAG: acid-shock protein [Mesorhizobium sp.]RWK12697.1 MAG: acid-shock protein [Mesorhizobium sp.]